MTLHKSSSFLSAPHDDVMRKNQAAMAGTNLHRVDRLVNLTPHPIHFLLDCGCKVTVPPSGTVPRVTIDRDASEAVYLRNERVTEPCDSEAMEHAQAGVVIPLNRPNVQGVYNLPEPEPGVAYIVSRFVAETARERRDLYIPDMEIRKRAFGWVEDPNEAREIVGCRGLTQVQPS